MSFRPPRRPRHKEVDGSLPPSSSSPSHATTSSSSRSASPSKPSVVHHHLVPPAVIPKIRRPRHSHGLYLPGPEHIFTLPGQDYSQMPSARHGLSTRVAHVPSRHSGASKDRAASDDDVYKSPEPFDIINDVFTAEAPDSEEFRREKERLKKQKQWQRWTYDVIPLLLRPHLQLLRNSASLRSMPQHTESQCTCGGVASRHLKVVCVHFEYLRAIKINTCQCSPAALQLLSRGLFPCAPIAPTLAVDVRMLEFVRELFVRMPPNATAWCDTLEAFLGKRAYKLTTRDTLRRRFSNALQWYYSLVNITEEHVQASLGSARSLLVSDGGSDSDSEGENQRNAAMDEASSLASSPRGLSFSRPVTSPLRPSSKLPISSPLPPSSTPPSDMSSPLLPSSSLPTSFETPTPRHPHSASNPLPSTSAQDTQTHSEPPLSRPSEYLRRRCPLCFGGAQVHDDNMRADILVAIDACFTQKRSKNQKNPGHRDHPKHHYDSAFLSEEDVKSMEDYVATRRATRASRAAPPIGDDEDGFENGMKVPTSVLNDCGESFKAADEKREKASTQYFAETGLMALLCRHDRVLWLVNMVHAGERQHYALALIQRLFEHIPPAMTVGILYDIGCQLHRSCLKWGFLHAYIHRIIFAISVFHAFGHQWPCQIIYHPRKCLGFGLTDGEGCERFWSAIKMLIPTLRISGYFQRLFLLDTQIKHLDRKSLEALGHWLRRRWFHCQTKKAAAEVELRKLGLPEAILRSEWAAQLKEQTKPAPRRSKNKGRQAVQAILILSNSLELQKKSVTKLEATLAREDLGNTTSLSEQLQDALQHQSHLEQGLRRKKALLGVSEQADLRKLQHDAFLRLRMNALALKQRIRDRLRQRKFEIERLERSYRRSVNDAKLHGHVKDSLKRREPTILRLAKDYNDLCRQISALIRQRKAPAGAVPPKDIIRDGLFKLDVDDEIWQDAGLDDEPEEPPLWLSNEGVRQGIRHLLEQDRCEEEEVRLIRERRALQEWLQEEWQVNQIACEAAGNDVDLRYQLDIQSEQLCRLCVTWKRSVLPLPDDGLSKSWGPSEQDLQEAAVIEFSANWIETDEDDGRDEDDSDESADGDWEDVEDIIDGELVESLEALAFADEYRRGDVDHFIYADTSDVEHDYRTPSASPRKRNREF